MSRRRRRTVRRLLFGATLTVILAVVVREPLLPPSPTNPIVNARLVHGLGLSPVLTDVQGPCPTTRPANMIWAATYGTCLTLAEDGLHITAIKAVQIVDKGPFWTVHLELEDQDAATLARLTRTLASNPSPRNELAVILHGPPGGLVLSAPVVVRSINAVDLDAGPTQAGAIALRDETLE